MAGTTTVTAFVLAGRIKSAIAVAAANIKYMYVRKSELQKHAKGYRSQESESESERERESNTPVHPGAA